MKKIFILSCLIFISFEIFPNTVYSESGESLFWYANRSPDFEACTNETIIYNFVYSCPRKKTWPTGDGESDFVVEGGVLNSVSPNGDQISVTWQSNNPGRLRIFYPCKDRDYNPPGDSTEVALYERFDIHINRLGIPKWELAPTDICFGQTRTFSIEPLVNATSYEWQIPSGWKVNGQNGPIVITPTSSANIQASASVSNPKIKVRGRNANQTTCGNIIYSFESSELSPTLVGQFYENFEISANEMGGGSLVEFAVTPYPMTHRTFNWNLPANWIMHSPMDSPNIDVETFQTEGFVQCNIYNPICEQTQVAQYYYSPWGSLGEGNIEFNAYPNPVTSELKITNIDVDDFQDICLIDDYNQVVFRTEDLSRESISIDVNHLKRGIYYLKINSKKRGQITKKIIKN